MRALDVLRNNIVMAQLVTRDSDWEPGWQGQQLNIPYPGTFTASDKAADSVATVQTPSGGATVSLTLNKFKYVDFIVEDAARAQASSELLDRYVQPAVTALAEQVEKDLLHLVTAGNFTNTVVGTAGTDASASTVRSAKKSLTDAKIPQKPRYLAISTQTEIALLGDSNIANYFAFSKPTGVSNGSIGNLYGYETYPTQLAPQGYKLVGAAVVTTFTMAFGGQTTSAVTATSLTAATLQTALEALSTIGAGNATVSGTTWATGAGTFHIDISPNISGTLTTSQPNTSGTLTLTAGINSFAFHPEAIIMATRPFRDPPAGSGVETKTVQDPVSGLFLRVLYSYDIANRGIRVGFDMLYGTKVLRASAGTLVRGT